MRYDRSWPGTGAANIEIDATLLTVKLLMSMSGIERSFRIALCRQSFEACTTPALGPALSPVLSVAAGRHPTTLNIGGS